MPIQPYNHAQDSLLGIVEDDHAIILFARDRMLIRLADAIWRITPVQDRLALLVHLWTQVQADTGVGRRFGPLREMFEESGKGTLAELEAMAEDDDFDGQLPMVLHHYVALYVDTKQPVSRGRFSDQAFRDNYLGAHQLYA